MNARDHAAWQVVHGALEFGRDFQIEHEGKLYVGYSNSGGRGGNHNSAELAIISLAALQED